MEESVKLADPQIYKSSGKLDLFQHFSEDRDLFLQSITSKKSDVRSEGNYCERSSGADEVPCSQSFEGLRRDFVTASGKNYQQLTKIWMFPIRIPLSGDNFKTGQFKAFKLHTNIGPISLC